MGNLARLKILPYSLVDPVMKLLVKFFESYAYLSSCTTQVDNLLLHGDRSPMM